MAGDSDAPLYFMGGLHLYRQNCLYVMKWAISIAACWQHEQILDTKAEVGCDKSDTCRQRILLRKNCPS